MLKFNPLSGKFDEVINRGTDFLSLDQTIPQSIDVGAGCSVNFGTVDVYPPVTGAAVFPVMQFVNENIIGVTTTAGGVKDFFGLFGNTSPTFAIMQDLILDYFSTFSQENNQLKIMVGGSGAALFAEPMTFNSDTLIALSGIDSDNSLNGLPVKHNLYLLGDNANTPGIAFLNSDTSTFFLLSIEVDDDGDPALNLLGSTRYTKVTSGTGVESILTLGRGLLGPNTAGDGARIKFTSRRSGGLIGQGFDAGYIDVVADDTGTTTYKSHIDLYVCPTAATTPAIVMTLNADRSVTIPIFAGGGNRAVMVDNNGKLYV